MISIIVPVYKDEGALVSFMDQTYKFKGDYELIFVVTEEEAYLKDKYRDYRILIAPKGRSWQMNLGARNSFGDILLFLHCDSLFEDNILEEVEKSIEKSPAGCLRLYFDSERLSMKIGASMSRARVTFRNIAFGDQGIFLTRELFYELGGFKEIPLMEDYQLSMDIKSRGIRIRQADSKIITRAVRFEKGGAFKTMLLMQRLQGLYRKGLDPEELVKMYEDVR